MASTLQFGYERHYIDGCQLFLQLSQEHGRICECLDANLPAHLAKMADGKSSLNVLGVGSGEGVIDAHLLSIIQSKCPQIPITVDVVEPSKELIEDFKALVAKSPDLQKIPFSWHTMTSTDYEKQVQASNDVKKFDLIHIIQVLYYVTDYKETIKFFHSLLKENGRLLIIHEAANSGWEILWKTFKKELCKKSLTDYISAGDIKVYLDKQGLKYEEYPIPNTLDITDCFDENNEKAERLLDFMTDQQNFRSSLTPEIRSDILQLLRDKCSTERDGRVIFNCSTTALVVHP